MEPKYQKIFQHLTDLQKRFDEQDGGDHLRRLDDEKTVENIVRVVEQRKIGQACFLALRLGAFFRLQPGHAKPIGK